MTPSGERSSWSGNEGSSRAKGAAKGAERASLGQVCPPGASAPGGGRAGPWLGDRVPGWRRTRPGSAGSGPRARPPGRAGRASRAGRPGGCSRRCAPAPASLAPIPCGLFEPDGGAVTRSARSRRVGVGPGAGRARTTSEHDPSRDPPHAVTGCSDTEPHPARKRRTCAAASDAEPCPAPPSYVAISSKAPAPAGRPECRRSAPPSTQALSQLPTQLSGC